MNKSAFILAVLFFTFSVCATYGEITFSDPDLSGDNRLLFKAVIAPGGGGSGQEALFLARLSGAAGGRDFSVQQLSAYPEKMELLEDGRVLQIHNAFGSFRIPLSGGLLAPLPGLPAFAGGGFNPGGRAVENASSPDGRWILCLEAPGPALGNLVLLDARSGAKTRVASSLEKPGQFFPASWSPDSRFFIYERAGKLYYYAPGSSIIPADESLRLIGEGAINSVCWDRAGDFFYLRGSTLYKVRGQELFTRALYAGFLEVGGAAGKIPFEFDPFADRFWMAPDGRSLLLSLGRRGLMYVPLDAGAGSVMPYLSLPPFSGDISVLWSPAGILTVLAPAEAGAAARL